MNSKRALRAAMLARRHQLAVAEQVAFGREIQNTFLGLAAYEKATSVALYLPVNGEVPTAEVINDALASGKTLYLPVIDGEKLLLRQYSHHDQLKPGRFGILEPSADCLTVSSQKIDIFIVPGVVFDLSGNRGGYGKGYYDRLLHSCCQTALLVGFCYDFQLVDELAVEPHDVKMNLVITERRVISSHLIK